MGTIGTVLMPQMQEKTIYVSDDGQRFDLLRTVSCGALGKQARRIGCRFEWMGTGG